MDDLLASVSCILPYHLTRAYEDLAIGVVITDAGGLISFVNIVASEMFSPLQPVAFGFRTLLGLSGATGSGDLVRAVETGTPSAGIRIGLPDGRIFDGNSRPQPDGGALVTLFDVTAYVQGAESAMLDGLTGLATRAGFHKRLGELLAEGRRNGSSVAVVSLDLDKFKLVNDTLVDRI